MSATATRSKGRTVRPIRDPAFARRLEQAADLHPHCPPKHRGRLDWVRERLAEKGETVSNETVRKWFAGEAKPRPDKGALLAEIMQVDVAWLQMGIDVQFTPREKKVRNALAEGAVNVVAGLIEMDGGHPAFPEEDGPVDLHAIIKGAKYDLHVSAGERDGKMLRFVVPSIRENVIVLGLVRDGLALEIYEIAEDVIEKHGNIRGASTDVSAPPSKLRPIRGFSERL